MATNGLTTQCILDSYRKGGCSACNELCQHRITLHGLDGQGGRSANARIPADYRSITMKNSPVRESQPHIYTPLDRYVALFKRHLGGGERSKSLYLWSASPGTGKTTTAVAVLNAWLAAEYLHAVTNGQQPPPTTAVFLDLNELQTRYNLATMTRDEAELKRIGNDIKRAQSASFAVVDDIGVRDATEAFRAYVHSVINYRVSNALPTVYTSNYDISEMSRVFDARLYDRIRDQCAVMPFGGGSNRGIRRSK